MWEKINSRKHIFHCYSSPDCPNTYLLEGKVWYGFKAGGNSSTEWVAKAEFEGDGKRRMVFYQVFLSAASQ